MTLTKAWKIRIAAVTVLLVAAAGLVALRMQSVPTVEDAIDIVSDSGNFETAVQAGDSFARVADILFEAGKDCMETEPENADACAVLVSEASGRAQIAAFAVLRCTPAFIDQVRRGWVDYLEAIAVDPLSPDVPALPGVRC